MSNITMEVTKLDEAGYDAAMIGLSKSYKISKEEAINVSKSLKSKDYGENKFLESIYLWFDVRAPRYWWAEADTYRISTKQSESTMHTLVKELRERMSYIDELEFIHSNFEENSIIGAQWDRLLGSVKSIPVDISAVKRLLPEGFIQSRVWCFNYKTFYNIKIQRYNHRLPHWKAFIDKVISQINHPELME